MPAYVILTSKPGQFRTESGDGLRPVEAWDFLAGERKRAGFVIAEITGSPRVTIVDETPPHVVNRIPAKLLERFASVDHARREIEGLAKAGRGYILRRAVGDKQG
jgi:hypothetical protein